MRRRPIARVRERMVLGQVRPVLEADERVSVWAHVLGADDARPGLLSLTPSRCLVHFTTRAEATADLRLDEVTHWRIDQTSEGGAHMHLTAEGTSVDLRLPLTTSARAERATGVAEHLARFVPDEAAGSLPSLPFVAERRGVRGQARRAAVTFVGMLVMLAGLVLSSPGVPGPGALVFLAGLAILSREYDWARDAHRWVKRTVERGLAEVRRRRAHRSADRDRAHGRADRDRASRRADRGSGVTPIGTAQHERETDVTPDARAG